MTFWGVEIKPGNSFTLQCKDEPRRRLRISQATLGNLAGIWTSRSIVHCSVGNKSPIFLCSLPHNDFSSCQLDLEVAESEDVVFSVSGPRSVHLCGYFLNSYDNNVKGGTDSFGEEDIDSTSSEHSSYYNSKENEYDYSDSFIDDSSIKAYITLNGHSEAEVVIPGLDRDNNGWKDLNNCLSRLSEASQEQFIFRARKVEGGKNKSIVESAKIQERSEIKMVNEGTKEDDDSQVVKRKAGAVVMDGNAKRKEGGQPFGSSMSPTTISTEDEDGVKEKLKKNEERVEATERFNAAGVRNYKNQTTNDNFHIPKKDECLRNKQNEVEVGDAGKLKIKKRKQTVLTKLEIQDGGVHDSENQVLVIESFEQEEHHSASMNNDLTCDASVLIAKIGPGHNGKLKKKNKKKASNMKSELLEYGIRNYQSQAIGDRRDDIHQKNEFQKHIYMVDTGDVKNQTNDNQRLHLSAKKKIKRPKAQGSHTSAKNTKSELAGEDLVKELKLLLEKVKPASST